MTTTSHVRRPKPFWRAIVCNNGRPSQSSRLNKNGVKSILSKDENNTAMVSLVGVTKRKGRKKDTDNPLDRSHRHSLAFFSQALEFFSLPPLDVDFFSGPVPANHGHLSLQVANAR
jgi:hypothetical protein